MLRDMQGAIEDRQKSIMAIDELESTKEHILVR